MRRRKGSGIDDRRPTRTLDFGTRDDVEVTAAMHRQERFAREFEPAAKVALRASHAFGDSIEFASCIAEERVDLVGLAEIARPQHDRARFIRTRRSAHGSSKAAGSSSSSVLASKPV